MFKENRKSGKKVFVQFLNLKINYTYEILNGIFSCGELSANSLRLLTIKMIISDIKGIIEAKSIHWEMSESVISEREIFLTLRNKKRLTNLRHLVIKISGHNASIQIGSEYFDTVHDAVSKAIGG